VSELQTQVGCLQYHCSRCPEPASHVRYDLRNGNRWYCEACWLELRLRLLIEINKELEKKEKQ